MLILELFSGTKSIGKAFQKLGWDVFSVDIDEKTKPTLATDVLQLEFAELGIQPDFVWGSPPCTHYSAARTKAKTPRDLTGSDRLVQKVLDAARYFKVPFMFENPFTGLLKHRAVVEGIPMQVVDYCKYGKPYRKRTSIWTNTGWKPKRCLCKYDCAATVPGCMRHKACAQQGPPGVRCTRDELYSIPENLCDEIAMFVACSGNSAGSNLPLLIGDGRPRL